ncbi:MULTISPECIES: hypothetical protein [Burkholderia cepacia complex]|uniref:hypothetical protein n=1 Tax=Burkholderia cepacia complex TaxID=87882 RepID=UPI0015820ED7|nr:MULTISPECIES: hypothetical protein [Burkholderia cepacia complex]MDN7631631.1 hypothetical protein [Burkholderia cenocepacia]
MRKHSTLRRRPLTKAQLLPLPAEQIRRLALKHHLALAALCEGRGDVDAIVTLSNVLALAVCLSADEDAEPCRRAGNALAECIARAEHGDPWTLNDSERTVLKALVLLHDEQLSVVPVHRYLDALEQLQRTNVPDVGLAI